MTVRRAATWSARLVRPRRSRSAPGCGRSPGSAAGETYLAGYVMEKALSLDNVFVFTLIFAALAVPARGAAAAAALRHPRRPRAARRVHLRRRRGARELQLGRLAVRRAARLHGREDPAARRATTTRAPTSSSGSGAASPARSRPLLALLAIAFADVLFAVDTVPAILAITTDTFVVFAANAFALMGLRALFFLVAGLVDALRLPAGRPRRAAHRHRRQARLRRVDRREDPHHRDARLDRRRPDRRHRSRRSSRSGATTPDSSPRRADPPCHPSASGPCAPSSRLRSGCGRRCGSSEPSPATRRSPRATA